MKSFEERQRVLVQLLADATAPVGLEQIQRRLDCSRRTVYYLVSRTNDELAEAGFGHISNKRGQGWYLADSQKKRVISLLDDKRVDAFLSPNDRLSYLGCWLQYPSEPVHVETIMRTLDVSRNTVFGDLKKLKAEFEGYDLSLEFDPTRGYFVVGKGLSKRAVLMHHLKRLLRSVPYDKLHFLDVARAADYNERLSEISEKTSNGLGEQDALSIGCMLAIIVDAQEPFDCSFLELAELKKTDEFQLVQRFFSDLNDYERLYLSVQLLGSRAGRLAQVEETADDIRLFELAQRISNLFERVARCEFVEKDGLVNSLFMHFKLSAYYYRLSIQIINPFERRVQENYPDLYRLVSDICEDNKELFPFPLLDGEKAYVAMHFGGHLRLAEGQFYRKVRVLVVCPSGIATSRLLSREIEALYSNVTVVAIATVNGIEEYRNRIDFIVSTIPIKSDIPWLRVSPLLSARDKARIASMMALNFRSYEIGGEQIESLLGLISRYVPADRLDAMKRDVYAYLQHGGSFIEMADEHGMSLADVLSPDDVIIEHMGLDWRTAIRHASESLLRDRVITDRYIGAMIDLVEENGPYIVLRNGVAIAHAQPSEGVMSFGISLLVSSENIPFDEGCSVRLLFVLASPEPEAHLHMLREIMALAKAPSCLDEICRQGRSDHVCEVVTRFITEWTDAAE